MRVFALPRPTPPIGAGAVPVSDAHRGGAAAVEWRPDGGIVRAGGQAREPRLARPALGAARHA